jgi:hypothetical protein
MPLPPFVLPSDGAGETLASFSTTLTIAGGASAIKAGDLMRVALSSDETFDATGITGSGFTTFTRRAFGSTTVGGNNYLSIWYATATGDATGFSLTATWPSEFDDVCANWVIIRGAAASPFDPDASLPGIETGAPPTAVTFNTTNPNDLVFFSFAGDNGMWIEPPPQTVTPSPPWEWLTSAGNTGGFGVATLGTYTQTASSPLSGATAANDITVTTPAIFIVDAIAGAASARPFLIRPTKGPSPAPQRPFLIRPNVGSPRRMRPFLLRPTRVPPLARPRPFLIRPTSAQVIHPFLPGFPTGEACGPATMTSITPMWMEGSGGTPDTYTLQWRPPGGAFAQIAGITETEQQITGLLPDTKYEWQVDAVNAGGSSGFSASFFCSTLSTFHQAFDVILSVSRDSGAYNLSQVSRSFNVSNAPRPTAEELFNTGAILVFQTAINVANSPDYTAEMVFTAPDGSTVTAGFPQVYVGNRYLPTPVGVLEKSTYLVYVFGPNVLIRGRWRLKLSFSPYPGAPSLTDWGSFHVPQHPPRFV